MKTTTVHNGRYQPDSMTQRRSGVPHAATARVPEPQYEDTGEWKEVDENEGFEPKASPLKHPRVKGKKTATITSIRSKDSHIGKAVVTRYFIEIQLQKARPDGTAYIGNINCIKSWKPGSEYRELAANVLGRDLTPEELQGGVRPVDLKNKPFTVDVTEHRKKDSDDIGSGSIIKIGDTFRLQDEDVD